MKSRSVDGNLTAWCYHARWCLGMWGLFVAPTAVFADGPSSSAGPPSVPAATFTGPRERRSDLGQPVSPAGRDPGRTPSPAGRDPGYGENTYVRVVSRQAPAAGTLSAEQKKILLEIRQALADRDIEEAAKLVAEAKKIAGAPAPFTEQVDRLETLTDYVTQFWKAVDRGARAYEPMSEVVVGESTAVFVEFTGGELILRVEGRNKRYTFKTVKAKMSAVFAAKALDAKAPSTKVIYGAFWAMDGMGDRQLARQLWDEAGKAGQPVKELLPELGVAAAKSIEIPVLPPQYKALLTPKNWQVRAGEKEKIVRVDLGAMALQNAEGRLEVKLDQLERGGQVVFRRKLTGNFTAKLIVQDAPEGATFGLYSADAKDGGSHVVLPGGTLELELVRQGQNLTCKVNGEEMPLEAIGTANPRLAGQVGIGLPAKGTCTLAAFDLK